VTIFITGATGFIGSHLVNHLSRTGHRLVCLARPTSDRKILEESGATIVFGDVTDRSATREVMQGCQWVVHLASTFEFWVTDKRVYRAVNVDGTRTLMENALEAGVTKVIHVSTAAVYGNAEWPISEETPFGLSCASMYAQTKREGDALVWKMYRERGLPVVGIMPGAVLGPNDPKAAGRYVANFARGKMPAQVLTRRVFPFVHVRDVCGAIVLALELESTVGEKYLIVGQNMTFGELNKMISDIAGAKLPLVKLPDWLSVFNSYLFTALADLTGGCPLWDMSVDQIALMKMGGEFDGSKATRQLGLTYTPIRLALEEAIASLG